MSQNEITFISCKKIAAFALCTYSSLSRDSLAKAVVIRDSTTSLPSSLCSLDELSFLNPT